MYSDVLETMYLHGTEILPCFIDHNCMFLSGKLSLYQCPSGQWHVAIPQVVTVYEHPTTGVRSGPVVQGSHPQLAIEKDMSLLGIFTILLLTSRKW